MAKDLFTTWNPLNFSPTNFPENFPKLKRLTIESDLQKERLEKEQSDTRYDHLKYLNEHLEIRAVLREFLQEITKEFPNDTQIPEFCNKLFGQCKVHLQAKILKHVRDLEEQRRQNLFPYKRQPLSSTSAEITSSSSGLFASSSGNADFICDCRDSKSGSDNKSGSSSSCTCKMNKSLLSCCECSVSYKSGGSCQCNISSSTSCSSRDIHFGTDNNLEKD